MKELPSPSIVRPELLFALALGLAWLSAGPIPFSEAAQGALSPSDFTRDFVTAAVLARGEPVSTLDGARGNAEAVRLGGEPVNIIENSPFHLHPPLASVPIRLLVPLGFRRASLVWLAVSLCLLAVLVRLLVAVAERVQTRLPVRAEALFGLVIFWPPTLTNLELGQWSILLAVLIALGFHAWEAGAYGRAAGWIATAASLKLTPFVLLPYLALRNRRAAVVFVAVAALLFAIALPLGGGLDAWMAFRRGVGTNVFHWQTWWHNTLSLNGFAARLFVGAHFARPLVSAPVLARALVFAGGATLVLAALAATRRAGPSGSTAAGAGSPAREGCVFALWAILVVVLNPLAWPHYALLLLLPVVLVLRAAEDPALEPKTRATLRRAVAAALVLLTVPKETVYLLVRPLPSSPLAAPLLSLHLFAALLLFGAAAHGARKLRPSPTSWAGR